MDPLHADLKEKFGGMLAEMNENEEAIVEEMKASHKNSLRCDKSL